MTEYCNILKILDTDTNFEKSNKSKDGKKFRKQEYLSMLEFIE